LEKFLKESLLMLRTISEGDKVMLSLSGVVDGIGAVAAGADVPMDAP
jgi:hypothetical protein